MKIVVNALSARLGGGQTYIRNLLARLPDDPGLELVVFAPASLDLPADPRIRRATTAWPTQNPLLRSLWERLVLPRILARERADLLFCPGGLTSTPVPAGCRTATMFRNMIPFDARVRRSMPLGLQRMRNWLLQRVMLRSMAQADLTIFISEHARKVIEALTPIRKAVTIPHGTGEAFRTAGTALARPASVTASRYLLYVSRFDVYKHHRELIEGYARLPAALRAAHPLLLVGETDLPDAQRVRAQIERLRLGHQVRIAGAIPHRELPAYYHHAEAILFASSCENCPNILLEGLASGRPVLSSNVMPMPEFGGPGIEYFSPFDPEDIARALRQVLTNPQRAREVAASALLASQRFDWAESAARTWLALTRVARGPIEIPTTDG